MMFDEIYGHDNVKQSLENTINNDTVSHAYIFCGKSGIGKTMMARAFANKLTGGSEVDIIFVTNEQYNVKEKVALSVETVRAARVDMYTKPYLSDKKVFIFPKSETMTTGAQNALLKVFEEPPPYCVIILLAQNENALLPTIRSRAVTIRFLPLPDSDVSQYLTDKYNNAESVIIRLASGSIADADNLMSQEETINLVRNFAAIFKKFSSTDKASIYEAISFFEKEKASYGVLLDVMSIMLRHTLLNDVAKDDIIKLDGVKTGAAVKIIDGIENARRAIQTNRNYNMVVSELMLEAWRAIHD